MAMNRRGFFEAVAKVGAGVAAGTSAATGASATPDVPAGIVAAHVQCPMCGDVQPPADRVPGVSLPDQFKSMARVQIATCCNEQCRARFAVRWVRGAV